MHVPCPSCGINLNVPDSSLGKNVKCSSCGQVFQAAAPEQQTVLPGDESLTATAPSPPPRPARGEAGARSDRGQPRGPAAPPPAKKSGLSTPLLIGGIAGGVLLLCCGGCGVLGLIVSLSSSSTTTRSTPFAAAPSKHSPFPGPSIPQEGPPAAPGNASITFAESVDRDTLVPTNVRDSFPPGQVHMIVRGDKAFNDVKMMVFFSREGAIAEQLLGEYTVDPKWNLYTVPINLNLSGSYVIKAKTTRGELIAEGRLTVR